MGIITLVFGLLNMPIVQEAVKERVVEELKYKLNTELSIEKLHIQPFNVVELNGVQLFDRQNEKILQADKLYARVALFPLLKKDIIITAIRLNDFDINLSKENSSAPLNIQFVIDAFKSSDEQKKPAFDVKINSVSINNGNLSYNIKDKLPISDNKFDQNHIEISDFSARLSLKSLKPDSLNLQVRQLSLIEKSGFEIKDLAFRFVSQGTEAQIRGFRLELPESVLQFSKCEMDMSKVDIPQNFTDSALLSCTIESSYITLKDISAFSNTFKNFEDRIYLDCSASGSINNFKVSHLSLGYDNKMYLVANATISNILKKDELYLSGSINNLQLTSEGISNLMNNLSGEKKPLPKMISNLGTINFNGNITGHLNKLRAHGLLSTQLGAIQAKLDFGFNPNTSLQSFFIGQVSSNNFRLGDMLNNPDFDKLSFDLSVDLKKHYGKKIAGKVKGDVNHFDYKNYNYQNISLNGQYDGLKIEGEMIVDDENVFLDVDGLFDLSQEYPVLNFVGKLQNLRIDQLNLSDKYDNSYLSLNINANFTGNHIDNAEGYLNIDSIRFYKGEDHFFMDNFMVEASGTKTDRKLKISSGIINGEILGEYSFLTMIKSLQHTIYPYMPALIEIDEKDIPKIEGNNLSLNFTIGNTEQLSKIFSLPFTLFSEAKIIGFYNNIYDKFRVEVFYPSGKVAGINIKSAHLIAENSGDKINTNITGLFVGKNNILNDISININAQDNNINTELKLTNNSQQKFDVSFAASASFSKDDKNAPLTTQIDILPRNIIPGDTLWTIEKSEILIKPDLLTIKNFNIHNNIGSQSIELNGKYSKSDPNEMIKGDLKRIDLEYVFNTLAIDALNFGGYATGTLNVSSIEGKPYPHVNLEVDGFQFNKTHLGHLKLSSQLEEKTNKILLNGTILDKEKRQTSVEGYINPIKQELSLNFDANKVDVSFLNKYAATLFNNVSGRGSGKVHLFGNFSKVTVEGKAFIENGNIGINFLNTNYSFTDTVYLKKDLIYFNDITFYDPYNNNANISGKVVHDYFADFMYYVELTGNNFMLYNVTEKQNPMFFGKAFGSGSGSISGDERNVDIDARLRTNNNTNICMNFMDESIEEYSFITYKDNDTINTTKDSTKVDRQIINKALKTDSGIDINMNFYIDATPDATVEIVMDPVGGDKLRGSGNGAIQFVWGTKTAPRLYGTYTITKGSYNFTFQKILERRFSIQSGSSVLFRGDPFQANLDVTAIYRLNANLKDLDQSLYHNTGQGNIPVECILNITGELQHPNVGLDIALPNADPEVQRQVKSLMNTEDMINRQMVYLLLLSKFYSPSYFNVENKTNDFASVASATLSTQLSKVLSRIDDRWQFGTNIRTSDQNFTDTEVELLLSSQILDDRVLINGNFGYRNYGSGSHSTSEIQDEAFTGDIDIEVLLNRIGTWRLKAYSHYNEKYYIYRSVGGNKSMQTQGIGLLFKKDFDSLGELFNFKFKAPSTPKDTIVPILPDSTIKGSSLGEFVRIKK